METTIQNLPDFLHFKWIVNLLTLDKQYFHNISYIIFICGILIVLVNNSRRPATYGKFYEKSQWHINPRLAWFVQELPSFIIPVLLVLFSDSVYIHRLPNKVLIGCFILHYTQRALIYPSLITGTTPFPVETFLYAIAFCTVNGYLQAGYIILHADLDDSWVYNPIFYLGIILFFIGMYINVQSDHILRHLRKPGEKAYHLPRGGLFEYVSSANYLGEIIEWAGFAIANPTLPALAMVVFTFCNLSARAVKYHRYYKEKFEDYPKNRKALIPFIL